MGTSWGLGYRVGRGISRKLQWVALAAVVLVGISAFISWSKQKVESERVGAQMAKERAELEKERSEKLVSEETDRKYQEALTPVCGAGFAALSRKANKLVLDKKADAAFELIRQCADYKELSQNSRDFLFALSSAADDESKNKEKAQELRNLALDKAERKKSGVSIGMARDQVLASNWGKPRKINRTSGVNYEHEQWVYDGGYLYFQQGILTTIQN